MQVAALEAIGVVAGVLFITTLIATASWRAKCNDTSFRSTALAEYLWALIPWVMIAACVLPAVRLILDGARAPQQSAARE